MAEGVELSVVVKGFCSVSLFPNALTTRGSPALKYG